MAEHIVKEGVYVYPTDTVWPEKPDEQVIKPVHLRDVVADENYPFLDKSFKARFWHALIYAGIFTLVFPLQWLRYGLKFEGRENLRKNKKLFKNGALTVCNHVYRWDFLTVVQALKRQLWFPALKSNLEGKDQLLIRSAGGIPVADNFAGMKKFYSAFDELHAKKQWIHVFPESSRWQWYQPIRPFKRGAFEFARRYNIPVVPMVLTYRPVTGWRKLFGIKNPLVTLHIGTPFMPDENVPPKQDARRMREEAFSQMCDMAGIIKNQWPCEGD